MGAEVKSMDIKKTQQVVQQTSQQVSHPLSSGKALSSRKIQDFITEIKSEIQKITWTNKDELIFYTKLVVGATFAFGMSIYLLDLLIQGTLGTLNFVLHLISG